METAMRTVRAASLTAAIASVFTFGWPTPGRAHHSFAMYDQARLETVSGRLTRFIPGANHAQMIFELIGENGQTVVGADGKPVMWGVEMGPAARIALQGVTPDAFPVGTILTVSLHPMRNGKTFGAMPNGSPLVNCGMQVPSGGCNADTGKVFLGQND